MALGSNQNIKMAANPSSTWALHWLGSGSWSVRKTLVVFSDLVLENVLGTVYFGSLTGPEHQVFHQSCSEDELLIFSAYGPSSVSIMFRTALFPYVRSRTRKGMPYPPRLFSLIEYRARQLFAHSSFILPSLDECLHFLPEKLADPNQQPVKRMPLNTKTKLADATAVY